MFLVNLAYYYIVCRSVLLYVNSNLVLSKNLCEFLILEYTNFCCMIIYILVQKLLLLRGGHFREFQFIYGHESQLLLDLVLDLLCT